MYYHLLPLQVVISLSVFFVVRQVLTSEPRPQPIFNAPYFSRFLKCFKRPDLSPFTNNKIFLGTVLGAFILYSLSSSLPLSLCPSLCLKKIDLFLLFR